MTDKTKTIITAIWASGATAWAFIGLIYQIGDDEARQHGKGLMLAAPFWPLVALYRIVIKHDL